MLPQRLACFAGLFLATAGMTDFDAIMVRLGDLQVLMTESSSRLEVTTSQLGQIQQSTTALVQLYRVENDSTVQAQYRQQIATKQDEYCKQAATVVPELKRQFAYAVEARSLANDTLKQSYIEAARGEPELKELIADAQSGNPLAGNTLVNILQDPELEPMKENIQSVKDSNMEVCNMTIDQIISEATDEDPLVAEPEEINRISEQMENRTQKMEMLVEQISKGGSKEEIARLEEDLAAETTLMCGDMKIMLATGKDAALAELSNDLEVNENKMRMIQAYNTRENLDKAIADARASEDSLKILLYAANGTLAKPSYGEMRNGIIEMRSSIDRVCDKPRAEMLAMVKEEVRRDSGQGATKNAAVISGYSMAAGMLGLVVGALVHYCYYT